MLTKNEWIAVVIGIVVVALFLGSRFIMSSGQKTNPVVDTSSQIQIDTISSSTTKNESTANNTVNNTKKMDQNKTGGLIIKDVVVGTGAEAKNGNMVSVHYTGKFADGKVFDSSIPRGQPIEFQLGAGMVIKGWEQGILGMKVGGKRTLTIPPEFAYGPKDYNGIPGGSTLYFDVELVGVKVQ